MATRPRYSETPGILDISIIRGNVFGPMRLTPAVAVDISGRTYTAAAYDPANNAKLADFVVEKIDAVLGIIETSMTATESAKLPIRTVAYEIVYVETSEVHTEFAGELEVRLR
jgi:hypothetical protein